MSDLNKNTQTVCNTSEKLHFLSMFTLGQAILHQLVFKFCHLSVFVCDSTSLSSFPHSGKLFQVGLIIATNLKFGLDDKLTKLPSSNCNFGGIFPVFCLVCLSVSLLV